MRYIMEGVAEHDWARHFSDRAAQYARFSNCRKSKRGAVIERYGEILGRGYLFHEEPEIHCSPCVREDITDNTRREVCGAMHAERMAVDYAKKRVLSLEGSTLHHIKVINGDPVPSGPPSCYGCSSYIKESGISQIVLLREPGFAVYDALEFNMLSRLFGKGLSIAGTSPAT